MTRISSQPEPQHQPATKVFGDSDIQSLARQYLDTRSHTEALCAGLETEDHVVQPAPFVSPPKWHLAHTTWFFERFILEPLGRGCLQRIPGGNLLFNSYYKSQGEHWLQAHRGHLSRPSVSEVLAWRQLVDEEMTALMAEGALSDRQQEILTIGIHHEKQHQELLLMDIKYILAQHPWAPPLDDISLPVADVTSASAETDWLACPEGLVEVGVDDGAGFSYDNERPRHRHWLAPHSIAGGLVTNAGFQAFIDDDGYQRPELWLSDGWDWVTANGIRHPLYWHHDDGAWSEYHLGGRHPLSPALPVTHVSYFEADAYAHWAGARLPTEFELERFLCYHGAAPESGEAGWAPGEAVCPNPGRAADAFGNGLLWQWTQSAYAPYPGFVPEDGALGEYNGKFMCNQYVLRGGSVATPRRHLRHSYRNFFRAEDRWAFTGIRLAKD